MKKFLSITLVLAIALALCLSFVACKGQNADVTGIDYGKIFTDYLEYPDAANVESMNAIERNVSDIYNDPNLTDAEKIAQMMEQSTQNEIKCAYFAYFIDRIGETKMGNNHGKLVYQRLRRQTNTYKDDTTLKLPINHNFDAIASKTMTQAQIRYNKNGKLYRIVNKDKIIYDETTGLLTVDAWKKGSDWDHPEDLIESSRNYSEARKTCVNWNAKDIVDSSKTMNIAEKTDSKGNKYYALEFSVNVEVANADETTLANLKEDNGGETKYEYCNLVVEIWENGLAKKYNIKESWNGKVSIYSGSAQCESTIVFSYSERDVSDEKTAEIKAGIKR